MRPLSLELEGLTSFKHKTFLDLRPLDLFVISGPTGSGKSTLLDAIQFALFGEVPRLDKTDTGLHELIAHGAERLAVRLEFSVGGQVYRIVRTRRLKGGTQVMLEKSNSGDFVSVAEQVRAVDAEVRGILGMGFDAFTQSVILPQGSFATFLHSKPKDRRQRLNELLRLQVYEEMRRLAAMETKEHGLRLEEKDAQLARDFAGVDAEALARLREQHADRLVQSEAAALRSQELQVQYRQAEQDHARTLEFLDKELRLRALQARQQDIAASVKQVERARSANAVVPWLDQARTAMQASVARQGELTKAEADVKRCRDAHERAAAELTRAREGGGDVPGLRDRLMQLAQVLGKRDEHDRSQGQLQKVKAEVRRHDARRTSLEEEFVLHEEQSKKGKADLARAEAALAALAYDAELDRLLDSVRDETVRLLSERARLESLANEATELEEAATRAASAAARAAQKQDEAARRMADADERLAGARAQCEEARRQHSAAHLRQHLAAGEPCPVCNQPVAATPKKRKLPQLDRLEQEVDKAQEEAQKLAHSWAEAKAKAVAAAETAKHSRSAADKARVTRAAATAALRQMETHLLSTVGERLADFPLATLEDRIAQAAAAVNAKRSAAEAAARHIQDLKKSLAVAQERRNSAHASKASVAEALERATKLERELTDRMAKLEADIRAVCPTIDPKVEQDTVAGNIATLEAALKTAESNAAHATTELSIAAAGLERTSTLAQEAAAAARSAQSKADETLAASGFTLEESARAAALPTVELQRLQQDIDDHRAALVALEQRRAELAAELGDRRVSAAELAQAKEAFEQAAKAKQSLHDEHIKLGEHVQEMTRRLAQAERLRVEAACHRQRHTTYRSLAEDLQSDRFQDYLLEEAFHQLVRGASLQLARLSTDRFGLAFEDKNIVVIDRDNADQRRSTDTLSGGETFLASLALALELSTQIQQAVGAVRLDCLFIDEGFGTLDPDTLRVVADAVRALQVGGRMVGIITHIPELKDEFTQRVLVEKNAGVSRLRVEID